MPSVHISYMHTVSLQWPPLRHKESHDFLAGVEIAALASTLLYRYVNVPQRALASHAQAAWVDPCICYVMCIDIYYLSMYTAIYMRTSRKGLQWPGAGLSGEQRYDAARWRCNNPRAERFFTQPENILYTSSVFE